MIYNDIRKSAFCILRKIYLRHYPFICLIHSDGSRQDVNPVSLFVIGHIMPQSKHPELVRSGPGKGKTLMIREVDPVVQSGFSK
jgi:hypothetical protein